MTGARTIRSLTEAFAVVERWVLREAGAAEADVPPTQADLIADAFGLDLFARNLLLVAAWAELDMAAAARIAEVTGGDGHLTYGAALGLVPGANWSTLAPSAPLRQARLVTLQGPEPVVRQRVRLAEPVLMRLLGVPALGDAAASVLQGVPAPVHMTPARSRLAQKIAARADLPEAPALLLEGPDTDGKLQALAAALGPVMTLDAQLLPLGGPDMHQLGHEIARDLVLVGASLAIVETPGADMRLVPPFLDAYPGTLAVVCDTPLRAGRRPCVRLELESATTADQGAAWRAVLPAPEAMPDAAIEAVARSFRLPPEHMGLIASELDASLPANAGPEARAVALWEACRRAARPRLDDLAHRIPGSPDRSALVLPERADQMVDALIAQVRHRAQVYEDWGFADRVQNKGTGLAAMFTGPPGTGKSLAAEVIGAQLGLDVYRVDLSAIVSKWMGETEKNLRRVFDAADAGGSVLLFDEADALFGRRSEVKDSRDRNANMEVSYLLQRIEAFRGLCILTTNLADSIDDAFLRRFAFVIDFRFPSAEERRRIWQAVFPRDMPREGLDLDLLAQLNLPGGSIRNIALGAAFLAAERGTAVGMGDLADAARLEYAKQNRQISDAELRGWPQ